MSSTFLHLPLPLLLLIHLHILNYPQANEAQYDNQIFDARVKGLKNRIKMMEDICYFLVGQLEIGAKNVLPVYPCSQPSDSVAFRTLLFKYLESLRHRALFSSSSSSTSSSSLSSRKLSTNAGGTRVVDRRERVGLVQGMVVAWWWKDVVVRKSLLEECCGERFERLLVAFSTHVLLCKSSAYTKEQLLDISKTASAAYNMMLSRFQTQRLEWLQKATLLSQRRQKLYLLRNVISTGGMKTRLQERPTESLLALVKFKYNDVQNRLWKDQQGSAALINLFRLAGVNIPGGGALPLREEAFTLPKDTLQQPVRTLILPIAAARHPAELKRLRRSVISPRTQNLDTKIGLPAWALLSNELVSVERRYERLERALLEARAANGRLVKLFECRRGHSRDKPRVFDLPWVKITEGRDLLGTPIVDGSLLESLSLPNPEPHTTFEERIDHIRKHLPSFPSPPDPHAPRVVPPEPHVPISQLPRPKPGAKVYQKSLQRPESVQTPRNRRFTKMPRKSIRASLAHNMVKHASDTRKQLFDDEVSKIILATEDDSMENIDLTTPRSKVPPPNRIWTSGQKKMPRTGSTMRTPRRSSVLMAVGEPLMELPLVPATSTGSMSLLDDEEDDDDFEEVGMESQMQHAVVSHGDGDYSGELPQTSMTLRELLLAADSSGFDLIGDEEEDCLETYPGWE